MSVDELNKMAIQIKYLEEQIERLTQQVQLIATSIINLENTNITVENIKTMEVGQEILIPTGNIAFLKGKIVNVNKIIINLGSDVFADVTIDSAKKIINNRLEDLQKTQTALRNRLQNNINKMNEIRPKFQELYTKLQGKSPPPPS